MFPRSSEVKLYVDDVLFANVESIVVEDLNLDSAAAADWSIGTLC